MTPMQIISFVDVLQKQASDNPTREGLGGVLKRLLKMPDRKRQTNHANWGRGITAMPAEYQNSSDAPPM